jgi:hypothetical protein
VRFVALAAAAAATVLWIVVATRGGGATPAPRIAAAAPDARPPDAAADAAVTGLVLTIANGVRFLAPASFMHTRIDDHSVLFEQTGIRMVVGVASGSRLHQLDEPKQAVVNYAKQEHVELAEMTTPETHHTLARLDSTAGDLHVLYIVDMPTYRAVVYLVVDARHRWNRETETLIRELERERLLLP